MIVCSSIFPVFRFGGLLHCVKVMSCFIYVMRPPPAPCLRSVRMGVKDWMVGVFWDGVSFDSWISMMSILC